MVHNLIPAQSSMQTNVPVLGAPTEAKSIIDHLDLAMDC